MLESISLYIIKISRKYFRNSWVHRLPMTSWLYKKLFLATVKGDVKHVQFMGMNIELPTNDTTIVPSIINNSYETFEIDLFEQLIAKENATTVFDVGANIGLYSLAAARAMNGEGKVFSFEPVKENRHYLTKNIAANKFNNIEVVSVAIGDKNEKIKMYLVKNSIGTHSAGKATDHYDTVDSITLDNFTKQRKVIPDIIKMDIEGYEGFAIEGGLKTIKKFKPTLLIEFDTDHLTKSNYLPSKLANLLVEIYPYRYIIDEKKKIIRSFDDSSSLVNIFNSNLIFSNAPIVL